MENLICLCIILDIITLTVSEYIFLLFYLVSKGIPKIQQKNSDSNNKNKEIKNVNNEEESKSIQTYFVPTHIFFNPMIKTPKGFYGKYPKKKARPFTERAGDWICKNCKNLNFAFRNECNRCKMLKKDCVEIIKNKEENTNENKSNNNSNKKIYIYKKHYTNGYNDKENKQKDLDLSTSRIENSFEE